MSVIDISDSISLRSVSSRRGPIVVSIDEFILLWECGTWGWCTGYEVRLVWEFPSRLDSAVRGVCLDAWPIGTRLGFAEYTGHCNSLLLRG